MNELVTTAKDALRGCLDNNGAVWIEENVPEFESEQLAEEIWSLCEVETIDAVEARRTELVLPPPTG